MPKILSDSELFDAVSAIAQSQTVGEAANKLGISVNTLNYRAEAAKKKGITSKIKPVERVVEPKELLAADRKVTEVKEDAKELKAKLKASEEEVAELQKQLNLMHEIEAGQGSRTIKIDKPLKTGNGRGIFCGVLSDLHLEESVTPESVPGYDNEFNLDIAAARMKKVFQSYVFMLNSWRSVGSCSTAVLAILGDIITNGIHEDAAESNNLGPSKAILFAQELISSGIEYVLSHGNLDSIILPCASGNHDRVTKKPRIATALENSWSYLLYKTLQREWRKEPRLDWRIAEGYHVYTDLPGCRVRWHHGDAITYGGGIGGITIPVLKKIAAWNSGIPVVPQLDCFGHFHSLMNHNNFICNGSLIGVNAYALNIGASAERPRQACFWLDSKLGKTMFGELFVQ